MTSRSGRGWGKAAAHLVTVSCRSRARDLVGCASRPFDGVLVTIGALIGTGGIGNLITRLASFSARSHRAVLAAFAHVDDIALRGTAVPRLAARVACGVVGNVLEGSPTSELDRANGILAGCTSTCSGILALVICGRSRCRSPLARATGPVGASLQHSNVGRAVPRSPRRAARRSPCGHRS